MKRGRRGMKLPLSMILLPLLIASGCASSDPWTRQDTTLQWIATGLLAIDAVQTSQIQDHPHLEEGGWVASQALGKQPTTQDTVVYFSTVAVSSFLISRALPARWRPFWQGAQIASSTIAIFNNCSLGLGSMCAEDHSDHAPRNQQ